VQRKKNRQVTKGEPLRKLRETLLQDMLRHPGLSGFALPRRFSLPIANLYGPGEEYGPHVDAARMAGLDGLPIRTDLSYTLFLSDPASYDGGALCFPETDLAAEARAGKTAGVARERPARRLGGGAALLQVLLGLEGVPPQRLGLETGRARVFRQPHDVRVHDALDPVERGAQADPVERIGPLDFGPKVDGVVVAAGESEPDEQPASHVDAARRNELAPEHAEGRGADQEDALFVEPDYALVGPDLEKVRQPEVGVGPHGTTGRRHRRMRRGPLRWRDDTAASVEPVHSESERFTQKFCVPLSCTSSTR
jgi:hypothetical protein